jgi:hypothetical protein
MQTTLETLLADHQALLIDHQELQNQFQKLRILHQKLQIEHKALQDDHHSLYYQTLQLKPEQYLAETEKNTHSLLLHFTNCVKGYHLINSEPINETIWETINEQVLTLSGYTVHHTSKGSHAPGCDIQSSFGTLSNKSAKYDKLKKNFSISSYRLTTVCSDKNCGNIQDILIEINRRKNFQFYSFLVRQENETENNDKETNINIINIDLV